MPQLTRRLKQLAFAGLIALIITGILFTWLFFNIPKNTDPPRSSTTLPPPIISVYDATTQPPPHNTTVPLPLPAPTETADKRRIDQIYVPIALRNWSTLATACSSSSQDPSVNGMIQGELKKWYPLTVSFTGPFATENDESPNPFLDYRLWVIFMGPSGNVYEVPGFFAGDGNGHGEGNIWQVRFAPDEAGAWRYCTSFRSGSNVAVSLDFNVGVPSTFDGAHGSFIVDNGTEKSGFLNWGRLEYVRSHYFKFHDGPFWIKSGTNSPENFLGYKGFDNTVDQGGAVSNFLHEYGTHVADWQPGDPDFIGTDSDYTARGIIGALNYLADHHINSIYFLPMNLGGDGQDTYPFIGASGSSFDNTHYDISKLHQWNIVFDHAQSKGIALHIVLNETETPNRLWLDSGQLDFERKLFYREMIARFGYILAIKWNLSEENVFDIESISQFTDYIKTLDWSRHPITMHTPPNIFSDYDKILGDNRFVVTSFQYDADLAGEYVETWRSKSEKLDWPWIIDMDENNPAGEGLAPWNADQLRKRVLYDVYFSGGNIEWYAGYHEPPIGGDMRLEDFRTREDMWNYMWYARQFMEENLPFWEMLPADHLLTGESEAYGGGEVFAKDGVIYAIYLPEAMPSGVLSVDSADSTFSLRWYNPRTGNFEGDTEIVSTISSAINLGAPPSTPESDWVLLVTNVEPNKIELAPTNPYP